MVSCYVDEHHLWVVMVVLTGHWSVVSHQWLVTMICCISSMIGHYDLLYLINDWSLWSVVSHQWLVTMICCISSMTGHYDLLYLINDWSLWSVVSHQWLVTMICCISSMIGHYDLLYLINGQVYRDSVTGITDEVRLLFNLFHYLFI